MANTPPVACRLMTCTAAGLLSLASASSLASSFALIEQSVNGMGSAYAIGSAGINDASTVYFNPAGMSRLSGTHLNGGLQVVYSQVDFKGSGEYNPNNPVLTAPTAAGGFGMDPANPFPIDGKSKTDTDLLAGVPSGYISHQYSDRVWFGLGVNAPFGLETDYDNEWVGRYNAIKSQLYTVNFNPSIAFKFTEHATIGFGLSALYADGELTQAVDGALLGASGAVQCSAPLGSTGCDGKAKLTGDDWGYGYNFGLLLEPTENTRFGFHYRSTIDLTLDGDSKVTGLPPSLNPQVPDYNGKQNAKLDISLPNSLSISGYHAFNSQWAVMADVTWTQWSQISSLDIKLDDGRQSVSEWDYEDGTRYAVGAEYRHDQTWTFRSGVALDQTPVPSDNLRSPRVPDADRIWLSFGTTYHYSRDISFDFGYAHLFVDDPKLDSVSDNYDPTQPYPNNLTGYHTVSGDYDASVDIIGVAVNWKFK